MRAFPRLLLRALGGVDKLSHLEVRRGEHDKDQSDVRGRAPAARDNALSLPLLHSALRTAQVLRFAASSGPTHAHRSTAHVRRTCQRCKDAQPSTRARARAHARWLGSDIVLDVKRYPRVQVKVGYHSAEAPPAAFLSLASHGGFHLIPLRMRQLDPDCPVARCSHDLPSPDVLCLYHDGRMKMKR